MTTAIKSLALGILLFFAAGLVWAEPDVRIENKKNCTAGMLCGECGCPVGTVSCGKDPKDAAMGVCKRGLF